jgi:hypothetical protein
MKLINTETSAHDRSSQMLALSQHSLAEDIVHPRAGRVFSNIAKTFAFLIYTSLAKPDFSQEKSQETNTLLMHELISGRRRLTSSEARRMALDVLELAEKRRTNFIEEEARRAISV